LQVLEDRTFGIIGNIHVKYNEQRGRETHTTIRHIKNYTLILVFARSCLKMC